MGTSEILNGGSRMVKDQITKILRCPLHIFPYNKLPCIQRLERSEFVAVSGIKPNWRWWVISLPRWCLIETGIRDHKKHK